jgi:hypothetical protein
MLAERIMPGEEGGPRQDTGRPSPAVTALLVLVGLGLWAGVVRACLLLVVQRGICRELAVALPEPARWLFGLAWWDWFGGYWWVVVLGLFALAPVAAWLTYWTRHRFRSRLAGCAWCALFLLPPLLLLEMAAQGLAAAEGAVLHGLRADSDDPANYLAPGGRGLRWSLKLREIRRGLTGPEGEVVVIETTGAWRVVPGLREGERPPLRRGRLTDGQLTLLAQELATLQFLPLCRAEEGTPALPDPPPNQDLLRIEFGESHLTLEGVRRQQLQQVQELRPWEADLRARFVPLVLVLDDLVRAGGTD